MDAKRKEKLEEQARAALNRGKEKAKNSNVVNTNDVPMPLRPIDRAAAQRRKIDNAYDSYMAKKLLPSLHDDK
jgi:hypothetical protein